MSRQREFQKLVGFPIDSSREVDRNEMAEKYLFKAIEEIIELRREFPSAINPWSKSQQLSDPERIKEEFSDVILFLINFAIVWKITPEKMLEVIEQTQQNNFNSFKIKKIEQLNREILSVPTYTSGVGQGNLNAKYVFIGQNPSNSISHGYRFWSDADDGSSKILLPILEKLGISNDCYFTNIVKSTTVDNQAPSIDLTEFWLSYLDKEIKILRVCNENCKIITMGKFATSVLEETQLIKGAINIPHPSYVLHGGLTKEEYEEEIKKAIL